MPSTKMPKQIFQIHLCPNAKKDEINGTFDGKIKISITAQPIDGKANEALIKFLSKKFHISKSSIEILRGLTSRDKTICIDSDKEINI
ncbi:MAG: YggU family protein [Alphaproteobacteria bacterium]|nr:YggU family protein [Alphaproteobacteria bacterium]